MDFLPNYKTFTGLALVGFGTTAQMFHWDWWGAIAGDVELIVNQAIQIVGLFLGIYGKIMAARREKALRETVQ